MRAAHGKTATREKPVRVVAAGMAPCLFYLAVEFGRPMDWFGPIGSARPGLLAAMWGFGAFLFSRKRPIPRPMWFALVFISQMALTVPWAWNRGLAFNSLQNFAILLLGGVLPLATLPIGFSTVRKIVTGYFFLHVPMAVHGLLFAGKGAGGGWLSDENDLALALNAAIGVGIYLMIEAPNLSRKLLIGASLGLMLAGVVATSSRGGFLGLVATAVYLVFAGPNRKTIVGWIAVGAVGLALLAGPTYWNEVRSIKTAGNEGDTGEQRLYLWGLAWRMYLDHPVLGVGSENFGANAPHYEDIERSIAFGEHLWGRAVHSMYFQLLSEHGTVGVLLFAMILGGTATRLRRIRRTTLTRQDDPAARSELLLASAIAAGAVGVLASGVFLSVLYYPVLWALIAMGWSLDAAVSGNRPAGVEAATRGAR